MNDDTKPCDDHDEWHPRCEYCRGLSGGTRKADGSSGTETIYVVKSDVDRMGRYRTVYVGSDVAKAVEARDDAVEDNEKHPQDLEVFIHVWEDGEHQYCTREDPRGLDR